MVFLVFVCCRFFILWEIGVDGLWFFNLNFLRSFSFVFVGLLDEDGGLFIKNLCFKLKIMVIIILG